MNRQFHNKRQSLTLIDKHKVSVNYSIDQNIFIGQMFNIKLEEKSYKMSFKALLVKIQRSKNRGRGATMCSFSFPPPGADRVKQHFMQNKNCSNLE